MRSGRRRFLRALRDVSAAVVLAPGAARRAHARRRRAAAPDTARIEKLAGLLQDTPRDRVFAAAAGEIGAGATVEEMLGALLLAGTRDISPRPPGTKHHAVLMIPSARDLSGRTDGADRWLPVFTNIDTLKWGQRRDLDEEGDWVQPPPPEPSTDDPGRARALLGGALEDWDERAAGRAAVAAVRTLPLDDLFEILWVMGARDHLNIGHKMIQVSQAYRALDMLRGRLAEPVVRSVVFGLLGGSPDRPSVSDFTLNRRRAAELPDHWAQGRPDPEATREVHALLRTADAPSASARVAEMLAGGVSPGSVWDGLRLVSSEMLFRLRGSEVRNAQLLGVHPITHLNALRFAWDRTRRDGTRRILILQAAAWTALSRDLLRRAKGLDMQGPGLDALTPEPSVGLEATLGLHADDPVAGARQVLHRAADRKNASRLMHRVAGLVRAKAPEHHHHKYAVAAFEEFEAAGPRWAPRVLAPLLSYLPTPDASDSGVAREARAALREFG